eukprot:721600-Hanusia_phi.AAC.2
MHGSKEMCHDHRLVAADLHRAFVKCCNASVQGEGDEWSYERDCAGPPPHLLTLTRSFHPRYHLLHHSLAMGTLLKCVTCSFCASRLLADLRSRNIVSQRPKSWPRHFGSLMWNSQARVR